MILNNNSSTFLNLLRVLAAQAVVVGHLISWLNIFPKLQPPYLPFMQGVGVVVFFILSGMVIPYSTSQKMKSPGGYSFGEYFIDRFARIYSALIPCLILVVALDLLVISIDKNMYCCYDGFNLKTFFGNVFMLEENPLKLNYGHLNITSFGSARPLWTLAIEWWIYFWFGFLYIVLFKQKKVNIITLLIFTFFSLVPFFNFAQGMGGGLMLPWLLGCVILMVLPVLNKFEIKNSFLGLAIIFLSLLMFMRFRQVHFEYVDFYYVVYLALTVLFLIMVFSRVNFGAKLGKAINVMADFSFTLYLVHYSILSLMLLLLKDKINPYLFFTVGLITANVISFVVARYTEMKYKTVRNFLKQKFIDKTAAIV